MIDRTEVTIENLLWAADVLDAKHPGMARYARVTAESMKPRHRTFTRSVGMWRERCTWPIRAIPADPWDPTEEEVAAANTARVVLQDEQRERIAFTDAYLGNSQWGWAGSPLRMALEMTGVSWQEAIGVAR